MILLGVDPGLTTTGYGLIEFINNRFSLIEAGVIRTDRAKDLAARLREIYEGLESILAIHPVHQVIIEELYSKYASPKTAILMGHARGVVYLAAARRGIPVVGYTATQVKSAIAGAGRASKTQIQKMIQKILNLPSIPKPADVADALALTITHTNTLGKTLRG